MGGINKNEQKAFAHIMNANASEDVSRMKIIFSILLYLSVLLPWFLLTRIYLQEAAPLSDSVSFSHVGPYQPTFYVNENFILSFVIR